VWVNTGFGRYEVLYDHRTTCSTIVRTKGEPGEMCKQRRRWFVLVLIFFFVLVFVPFSLHVLHSAELRRRVRGRQVGRRGESELAEGGIVNGGRTGRVGANASGRDRDSASASRAVMPTRRNGRGRSATRGGPWTLLQSRNGRDRWRS